MRRHKFHQLTVAALAVCVGLISTAGSAQAPQARPNILVIWGDDIGRDNISA